MLILPLLRLLMGLCVGQFLDSRCLAVPGGCTDTNVCVVCWVRVSKSINLILFMLLSETPLPMSMQVNSASSCTRSLTIVVRELGAHMEETSIRMEKDWSWVVWNPPYTQK